MTFGPRDAVDYAAQLRVSVGAERVRAESCTGVELVSAATCTLQVRFQPVSEGVKKATLGLFGESEGPTPIVLTGVGMAPDPAAAPTATPSAGGPVTGLAPFRDGRRRPRGQRRHRRHRLAVHDARLVLSTR